VTLEAEEGVTLEAEVAEGEGVTLAVEGDEKTLVEISQWDFYQ